MTDFDAPFLTAVAGTGNFLPYIDRDGAWGLYNTRKGKSTAHLGIGVVEIAHRTRSDMSTRHNPEVASTRRVGLEIVSG